MTDSKSFSDVDWDDGTVFNVLQTHGFWPYSGADGDLFRKHGLGGWRVSVHGRTNVRIQTKTGRHAGRNYWATSEEWSADPDDELSESQIKDFETTLEYLIEHDELPD